MVEHNASEVYKILEMMILTEEISKHKSAGENLKKEDKMRFVKHWKVNYI